MEFKSARKPLSLGGLSCLGKASFGAESGFLYLCLKPSAQLWAQLAVGMLVDSVNAGRICLHPGSEGTPVRVPPVAYWSSSSPLFCCVAPRVPVGPG